MASCSCEHRWPADQNAEEKFCIKQEDAQTKEGQLLLYKQKWPEARGERQAIQHPQEATQVREAATPPSRRQMIRHKMASCFKQGWTGSTNTDKRLKRAKTASSRRLLRQRVASCS
jgi:hypothetical protein